MRKEKCPSIQTCRHAGDDCTAEGAEERSSSCYEADTDLAPETQDPEETAETPEDGVFADEAAEPEQTTDEETSPTAAEPVSYVTPEPDKVSATFTRNLPTPVPVEELADYAKEQSRLYGVREKAIQDKKASNAAFTRLIKDTEQQLLAVSQVVEEGTEERPTVCQWEYHYREGVKKLRRLDNHKIVDEETLTGDEIHMSFNFDQTNGEDNVAKFFEKTAGAEATGTADKSSEETPAAEASIIAEEALDAINAELNEAAQESVSALEEEPAKEPSAYVCKVCGIDAGSHIYLVRHLRDVHEMKLSDYKKQFPVEG